MCTLGSDETQRPNKTDAELMADLLRRHLHIEYPIPAAFVTSLIHSQWGTLARLAHAIHDKDRRKGKRERRA